MNDIHKPIHDVLKSAITEIGLLFKKEGYGDELLPRDRVIYVRLYNANRRTIDGIWNQVKDAKELKNV